MISNDSFSIEGEFLKPFLRSLPSFPLRAKGDHKGTYGTSALLGGSFGMSGAMILAGGAALAAGSGLVRLLIPDSILDVVASSKPEYMTVPLRADRKGRIALNEADRLESLLFGASAVGIGPGLGRSLGLEVLIPKLYERLPMTTVIDADGLNALSTRETFLDLSERVLFDGVPTLIPRGARILTPHPGEFARMLRRNISSAPIERKTVAVDFVRSIRKQMGDSAPPTILVLKGAGTIVTDGENVFINETGNPGMATGGSGDVLTGIITAFAAQKITPFNAAVLGVALHGLAGDLAAKEKGMEPVTADDLIRFLPGAFLLYHQVVASQTEEDGSL